MSTVFLGTYHINDKSEGCKIHTSLTSFLHDDLPFYAEKNLFLFSLDYVLIIVEECSLNRMGSPNVNGNLQ